MTKEEIYDSEIAPLMLQVINICKKHKIAHICAFSIPNEEDDGLCCTTANVTDSFDPPVSFINALNCIKTAMQPERNPLMITTRDGGGNITRMDAIFP